MSKRHASSSEEESLDSEEEQRLQDLRERDEFSRRLKEKDEEKTRKIVDGRIVEASKRLKLDQEDREKLLPQLRVQSRRKYLEKRKEDKVAELEADILDDEYLFDDAV